MEKALTPVLSTCASFLVGAWLALEGGLEPGSWSIPLAGAVVVGSLGLPRGACRLLVPLAVGALVAWAGAPRGCLEQVASRRPVELYARQASSWSATGWGWETAIRVIRARQGSRVWSCDDRVRLTFSGKSPPHEATRVRVRGFVKRSAPLRNDPSRLPGEAPGPASWRLHLKSDRFWSVETVPAASSVSESIAWLGVRWRETVSEALDEAGEGPGLGAARALVLGDRDGLDRATRRTLKRLGLWHLFAVSGLHVALVALMMNWLARPLGRRGRGWLVVAAVSGYLVLVGARPSILRAGTMALLALAASGRERPFHPRQALCLVAMTLAALRPEVVNELAFTLTVSATAGILWLMPALEERWQGLPRPLARPLAATVAAQVVSLPWTASAFAMVHPAAPLLNLVAIPWMAVLGVLSFLATGLVLLAPRLGGVLSDLLDLAAVPLDWAEGLPAGAWATWPVSLTFFEALVAAVCLAGALLLGGWRLRAPAAVLALFLLRGSTLGYPAEMVALDVGQGDATLLHDGRVAVLVDGGGWRHGDIAGAVLVPALARLGVRRLEAVVITHADVDHCQGVRDLAHYLPIDRVWTAAGASPSDCVRSLVGRPGMRWNTLWAGQRTSVGRIELDALHPQASAEGRGNEGSLVIMARLGGRSVLLAGDIEGDGERRILARFPSDRLQASVLKLAHHGSKTSSTRRFLEAVSPRVALASAGRDNRYGHPADEVLERCRRSGARVLRTDRDGMLRLPLEAPGNRTRGRRPESWIAELRGWLRLRFG